MPFVNKPHSPADDIRTLARKLSHVTKPSVAISILKATYNRAIKARGCGQCLYADWLGLSLVALDRVKALLKAESAALVPREPSPGD